jgi:hypothetical protein
MGTPEQMQAAKDKLEAAEAALREYVNERRGKSSTHSGPRAFY